MYLGLSVHSDGVDFLTKKKLFDKVMLIRRIAEEEMILVQESKQHWHNLKKREDGLKTLLANVNADGKNNTLPLSFECTWP